jgi:hypothetical protein
MQAAERAGDTKKAAFFTERVLELTSDADTGRPETAQARRVLGDSVVRPPASRYKDPALCRARRRNHGEQPGGSHEHERRSY